jgi:hypothetical protein
MRNRLVHAAVPDELWLACFLGVLDEAEAIERGRQAARAQTEEERRRLLFGEMEEAPPPPIPSPGYRPCGSPPWHEP